jgi:6-phosphogluconate dehydrogenase
MAATCDIGLVGLAVMGENLVRNIESRGYTAAVFNRTTSKVDEFLAEEGKGKNFVGCHSLEELVAALKRPRRVMFMVKAGPAVDAVIQQVAPLLEKGDIIIDGGNSYYLDTERRSAELKAKGLLYLGVGVSGGEEGALKGPSIMPGGAEEAWPSVKPIFQAIAAKVGPNNDVPCCEWVGPGGSGHYVKMVHNGIEYGDMQLICEAYQLLKEGAGFSNDELHRTFDEWNRGELDSYLIEITRDIFTVKDKESGEYLVDRILDTAGQKGTGKWTSQLALDLGVPTTLVTEAVFARCLSALKDARVRASKVLAGPSDAMAKFKKSVNKKAFAEEVRHALYASKICSYAQGFVQLAAAAAEHKWDLSFGNVALLWRGGCIIRARFLERIKEAFDADAKLENLLLAPYFQKATAEAQTPWRNVVATAAQLGIPAPAFSTALAYYDGYRSARLPANLLQAQRDYFGAHTYQRVDKEGVFHTDWIRERKL